jgi:hypothetical protein
MTGRKREGANEGDTTNQTDDEIVGITINSLKEGERERESNDARERAERERT